MRLTMAAGNPARKYDIADHLFFKLQGPTPGALSEAVDVVKRIVKKHGGDKFWPAQNEEEAEAMWMDRKLGFYSALAYAGEGAKAWTTDVWCTYNPTHNLDTFLTASIFRLVAASRFPSSRSSYTRPRRTWITLAYFILSLVTQETVGNAEVPRRLEERLMA